MSIIITGLEMPTERKSFNLTIKYNGTVFDTETGMQVAEAHELPPHGRLIDADAIPFAESENGCQDDYAFRYDINEMPTIIEAEPEVHDCDNCKWFGGLMCDHVDENYKCLGWEAEEGE